MSYRTYSQVSVSGNSSTFRRHGRLIELCFVGVNAAPSNEGMQLTIKSVTPFACAKGAPLLLAADPRC
jgi:hypothetical protein